MINTDVIQVFSNPVRDVLTVEVASAEQVSRIDVLNAEGKLVDQLSFESIRNTNTFDVSKWSSGVYFVRVHSKTSSHVVRVMVR